MAKMMWALGEKDQNLTTTVCSHVWYTPPPVVGLLVWILNCLTKVFPCQMHNI